MYINKLCITISFILPSFLNPLETGDFDHKFNGHVFRTNYYSKLVREFYIHL